VFGGRDVPSHLPKELNKRGMHKTCTPHRYGEHDLPSRRCDSAFRIDGQLDLIKLGFEPVVIATIVVQLSEHTHSFIRAIGFNEIPRRFGEEHNTANYYQTRDALEGQWKAPGERRGLRDFRRAVADPGGNDKADPYHLLGKTDDETCVCQY
jgi:hypothetical protein